jgi:hypothetical protein
MSNFALTANDNSQTVVDTINYLLNSSTTGNSTSNTTVSGNVVVLNSNNTYTTVGSPTVISYQYGILDVRYANNSTGSSGFNTSPTNRYWYGLHNRSITSPASSNPSDYTWYQANGSAGFGTTNFLFYGTTGGRQVQFYIGPNAPSNQVQQAGTSINLDILTANNVRTDVIVSAYLRANTAPSTPTGGSYDFGSLTLTPPTSWSAAISSGTAPIYVSSASFQSPLVGNVAGPATAWSSPAIASENGASTYNFYAYAKKGNIPATPTANTGSWNFGTTTGTPPTGPDGTSWFPYIPAGNLTLWDTYAIASVVGSSGTATNLTWGTPQAVGSTPGTNGLSLFYYTVYQNSATQPSTPGASGSYNFATLTGTPPTGWTNAPTTPSAGEYTWVSFATASSSTTTGTWTAVAGVWSTPSNFSGTIGATGFNGYTANVSPAVVNYVMNADGTFNADSTIIYSSFSNGVNTVTANVYANISASGVLTYQTIYPIDTYIDIIPIETSPQSLTLDFQYNPPEYIIGYPVHVAQTALVNVQTAAFAVANPYAGSYIYNGNGTLIATISAAPVISITYNPGQYITQLANGSYNPAPFYDPTYGNIVGPLTANIVATRSANVLAWTNRQIYYSIDGVGPGPLPGDKYWIQLQGNSSNVTSFSFSSQNTTQQSFYKGVTYSDPGGTTSSGTQAAVIQAGAVGNIGATGNRGFIPMAYVVTPSDPNVVSSATLSSWFAASRTSNTAPIGTGYTPITGDTASFVYSLGGNPKPNLVATFNGSSNAWSSAVGQVINGNLMVAGTVGATQINANDVYALSIQSTNANLGNINSNGFWLSSGTGNARFGGNVSIGSNLTVGGLITSSALIANTVQTTTMVSNAVSNGYGVSTDTTQIINTPTSGYLYYSPTSPVITYTTTQANQPVYLFGKLALNTFYTTTANPNELDLYVVLYRTDSSGGIVSIVSQLTYQLLGTAVGSVVSTTDTVWPGFLDTVATPGTYTWRMGVTWYPVNHISSVSAFYFLSRSLLLQTLKR